ncbi:MAG: hypothetical protein HKN01_11200, partial [Acidimicrobiia bacterium]|nr:hypothetical protein [Acidimicrobiia bacterium]
MTSDAPRRIAQGGGIQQAGTRRHTTTSGLRRVLALSLAGALFLSACGGDSSDAPEDATTTRASSTTTTEARSTPSLPGRPGVGDADENPPAFFDGRLVEADYWDEELKILSANMGFDGIIGWPNTEFDTIRAGGGSFHQPACAAPDDPLVSGTTAATVEALY